MSSLSPSSPILVLGGPNSGAGTVTGLLREAASVVVGDVPPPSPARPAGSTAAVPVIMGHDLIFNTLRRDWSCPPGHIEPEGLPRRLLRNHVGAMTQHGEPWAVTEPRLLFALPAWLDLAASFRLVGVIRSPTAATLALACATGLREEDAARVVDTYLARLNVLHEALGFPIVDFSQSAAHVTERTRHIATSFDLPWHDFAAQGWIRDSLRHQRSRENETGTVFRGLAEAATAAPQPRAVDGSDIASVLSATTTVQVESLPRTLGPAFAERRRIAWRRIDRRDIDEAVEILPPGCPPALTPPPPGVEATYLTVRRSIDVGLQLQPLMPPTCVIAAGLLDITPPDRLGQMLRDVARHTAGSAVLVLDGLTVNGGPGSSPEGGSAASFSHARAQLREAAADSGWSLRATTGGSPQSVVVLDKDPAARLAALPASQRALLAGLETRLADLEQALHRNAADASPRAQASADVATGASGLRARLGNRTRAAVPETFKGLSFAPIAHWLRAQGRNTPPRSRIGFTYPLRADRDEERRLAESLATEFSHNGWSPLLLPTIRGEVRPVSPAVETLVLLGPLEKLDVRPGTLVVAWVLRTAAAWPQWLLADADLVLAGSRSLVQDVAALTSVVPDLAYPAIRTPPESVSGEQAVDYAFVGDAAQHADRLMKLVEPKPGERFGIYGTGWQDNPATGRQSHGEAKPLETPPAKLLIGLDDPRRLSLDPALMRAALAGTLPVTADVESATDMFGNEIPTFGNRRELRTVIDVELADDSHRHDRVAHIAAITRREHGVATRAAQISDAIDRRSRALQIALKICTPSTAVMDQWGDTHFARQFAGALRRHGYRPKVDLMNEWYPPGEPPDVVIHLRGLHAYAPSPESLNLLWIISHPEAVDVEECERYDAVLCASQDHAATLAQRVSVPVETMHQAADPSVFRFTRREPALRSDLLFVGNARRPIRPVPRWLTEMDDPLTIYGARWAELAERHLVKGTLVPNDELHRLYRSADIVVNDHWADMRSRGFISNRLFDALACGAFIISDHLDAIPSLFGDAVPTFSSKDELRDVVDRFRDDPAARDELALEGRRLVLEHHTFDVRAAQIAALIDRLRPNA